MESPRKMRSGEHSLERKPRPDISFGLFTCWKNGQSTAGIEAAIPPGRGFSTATWQRDLQGCENTSSQCGNYSRHYWGLSELCLWNEFNNPWTDTITWWFFVLVLLLSFPVWGINSPFATVIGNITYWAPVSQLLGILGAKACLGLEDMDYMVM